MLLNLVISIVVSGAGFVGIDELVAGIASVTLKLVVSGFVVVVVIEENEGVVSCWFVEVNVEKEIISGRVVVYIGLPVVFSESPVVIFSGKDVVISGLTSVIKVDSFVEDEDDVVSTEFVGFDVEIKKDEVASGSVVIVASVVLVETGVSGSVDKENVVSVVVVFGISVDFDVNISENNFSVVISFVNSLVKIVSLVLCNCVVTELSSFNVDAMVELNNVVGIEAFSIKISSM